MVLRDRIDDGMGRIVELVDRVRDRFRPEPEPRRRIPAVPLIAAGAAGAGALVEYFLDPDRGRGRRAKARDRVAGLARASIRRERRLVRRARSEVYGIRQRMAHRTVSEGVPDDATLAHKVESEILGKGWVDKGRINVNAQNHVVVLRGEVDRPEQIDKLERAVRRIPGVAGVDNLLHLKDTAARNKAAALEASRRAAR